MSRRRNVPPTAVLCFRRRRLRLLVLAAACALVTAVLSQHSAFAAVTSSPRRSSTQKSRWLTLNGDAPLVVARGGLSGLLPDSSINAYNTAQLLSLPDLVTWCDVQLTKDGAGICFPNINLSNGSSIDMLPYAMESTYNVNGVPVTGYFSVDFTLKQLENVTLSQAVLSRPPYFDYTGLIISPQSLFHQLRPAGFWLNVQRDAFYSQHNLSMRNFILGASKSLIIDYISSPELNFLKGLAPRFESTTTSLIFRFMGEDEIEPTTNQTYGTLSKNLTFINSFASGILVPKTYIWPVDKSLYLLPATSLVQDAHEAGLLVFAADFANDNVISYNYSYNPGAEYLQFIDNGDFSVDGVLTDFPMTPSAAIACFAHLGKTDTGHAKPWVISDHGASGDYPACTDLAYSKAISDGADIVDCNVQMSNDGVPFCLRTINLMESTTIAQAEYDNMTETIPQLQSGSGIFTFRLTWEEIKGLTPAIWNPFPEYTLYRNPKFKNAGKLVSLDEFLAMTKNVTSLSGILIRIENAAYLAEDQGLDVIDAVVTAVGKAGYSNQTAQKLMIQSTNSSVLRVFKGKDYHDLVYEITEPVRDVTNSSLEEIQNLASTVVINKLSIYSMDHLFSVAETGVVKKLKAFNLTVFAKTFSNEFVSQPYDFFADPVLEINTYVQSADLDGVITDFPKTAVLYRRNRCIPVDNNTPIYMLPPQAGALFQFMSELPPAQAPMLVVTDVSEPPLPPVEENPPPSLAPSSPSGSSETTPSSSSKGSSSSQVTLCALFSALASTAAMLQF